MENIPDTTERTTTSITEHKTTKSNFLNRLPSFVILIIAWLVPGSGHAIIGEKRKGAVFFIAIVLAFLFGAAISNFKCLSIAEHNWAFLAQIGVGFLSIPIVLIKHLLEADTTDGKVVGIFMDPGLLYTQVAGILNMLIAIDAWDRSSMKKKKKGKVKS